MILLLIRMSELPERTKRLQESVMFLYLHYILINIQKVLIYITDPDTLDN